MLCFRPVQQLSGAAWIPYLQALERLAVAADREVLWLPFHQDQDRGLLARLIQQDLLGEALASRSRELAVQTPKTPWTPSVRPVWCWPCVCMG